MNCGHLLAEGAHAAAGTRDEKRYRVAFLSKGSRR